MNRLFYRFNKRKFIFLLFVCIAVCCIVKFHVGKCWRLSQKFSNPSINLSSSFKCDPTASSSSSEVIHLSAIIGGHNTARLFTVLIKSMLFYRRNYIQMHLIVDNDARGSLKTLFETWRLPQLTVLLYNASLYKDKIAWMDNIHYSGVYGLYKLILPHILPGYLEKVIFLDADLVFTGNIMELWSFFKKFNKYQAIGLVENQSDWYLKTDNKSFKPWPALGRGYNTGVMLMNLNRLRQMKWEEQLFKIIKSLQITYGALQLADQDPINSYINENPSIVLNLPCIWNVQQGLHSKTTELCKEALFMESCRRLVRIIHWNSRTKSLVLVKDSVDTDNFLQNKLRRYLAGFRQTFIEYDGNLLRLDLIGTFSSNEGDSGGNNGCQQHNKNLPNMPTLTSFSTEPEIIMSPDSSSGSDAILSSLRRNNAAASSNGDEDHTEDDECMEIRAEQNIVRRTHLNFLQFNYTATESDDVTLVSQLSLDRLQILETLAHHWPGPMSLSIYISDSEANQLVEFIMNSPILSLRQNIAFHVVYKEGQFYPINSLRNIAIQNAVTNFVFITDFDFLPSFELYTYSREMIRTFILKESSQILSNIALIVPAFETFQYRMNFPHSKAELLEMLNTGEVSPFRQNLWSQGHSATDYAHWKAATRPYDVFWKPDYEPYVVVSRENSPKFDTRFIGFGWNKVAFVMTLDIMGYKFIVLPNAFMIHSPHAPSFDVTRFRTTSLYRYCVQKFKIEYVKELAKKYGVRALKYLQFRQDKTF